MCFCRANFSVKLTDKKRLNQPKSCYNTFMVANKPILKCAAVFFILWPIFTARASAESMQRSQALDKAMLDASQIQAGSSLVVQEEPVKKALIQRGGLLLERNKLQLEPSITYAHVSANRITVNGLSILPILAIGEINSVRFKRDIFITAVSARYGLLNNLQLNCRVPYRYQYERSSDTSGTETVRSSGGIGDMEAGLYTQLLYEHGSVPGLIGGLNVKSDSGKDPYTHEIGLGTGHWGVKGNLVWVKSSDPAIFFGSFGYTVNLKEDFNGFGEVRPGNTFEYSLGLAFALNYQTAINLQIEQQLTGSSELNETRVPASFTNAASFKTGFTYSIAKNLSLDVLTSYGLSEDAPDFTLEVRLPYTF